MKILLNFLKVYGKADKKNGNNSKDTAKERLHLVLMQDRANVSADFLELMRQEIIEVIKKYIDVDESAIDVRMTNRQNDDGTNGAPALYANIPILSIKDDVFREKKKEQGNEKADENSEEKSDNEEAVDKIEDKEQEDKKTEITENENEETAKEEELKKTEEVTEEKNEPENEEENKEAVNKE